MTNTIDVDETIEDLLGIDEHTLTDEEPLISPEDAFYRKITQDNLETSYHIRGDLTEDVLTEGGKALGGDLEEDIIDENNIKQDKQPEST